MFANKIQLIRVKYVDFVPGVSLATPDSPQIKCGRITKVKDEKAVNPWCIYMKMLVYVWNCC